MNIEYGKLTKLLQKTFINAYIPDDKNAFDELVSYIVEDNNGEYSFELNKLLATKNKELKTYFESLLPRKVLEDTNERQKIINSYEDPDNIIEYGIPQVCLEDLYDSNFRKKLEEKNSFFKQLHNENSERYYEFNLVPEFLEKASRMWSVEYKQIKNKLVPEKFLWTGYEELTSRNQVVSNNELKSSGRTEVGVFEKSIYFIYETYAQGEYSKLHLAQKYGGDKAKEIELWNQALEKYIELSFDIISRKVNEYRYINDKNDFVKYGPIIRDNPKSETESDIKDYQFNKINLNLQKFNDYIPWDLEDIFTRHKNGKYGSLLETLYNDCRFAPSYYKSAQLEELFSKGEQDFVRENYKELYIFLSNKEAIMDSEWEIIYRATNCLLLDPEIKEGFGIFDKIEVLSLLEEFIKTTTFQNIIKGKDLGTQNLLFINDMDNLKWNLIKDKWSSQNTSDLNPNGSVRERYIAAGMSNDDVEYIKENSFDSLDDEDFNSMFSEEELDDKSENDELFEEDSTIDYAEYSEKDIMEEMAPDFDNDSADQDFGMEGIESNIIDDSISINCISKVEGKMKELFNNYFSSNLQFRNFMYNWCEYALTNYDNDEKLSNFENEYNAINDAFESFKFINKKKDENGEEIYYVDKNLMKNKIDFTKDVDKFLRAARKNGVKLPQEDVHLDKYNKDLRNLRRDFNNWFEKECK